MTSTSYKQPTNHASKSHVLQQITINEWVEQKQAHLSLHSFILRTNMRATVLTYYYLLLMAKNKYWAPHMPNNPRGASTV